MSPRRGVVFPPSMGDVLDIFRIRQYFDAITEARLLADRARADAGFIRALRRGALRLPWEGPPPEPRSPFPPLPSRGRSTTRRRVALVATGGSGALASVLGVLRAFEERRLRPASMSFASGAALFAFPVAAGVPTDEVAAFVLGIDPTEWVDIDWQALATAGPRLGRGFAGILKGERVEASYRKLVGNARLGDLVVPAYAPLWNVERNRVEYVGPKTHPRLPVAKAIRMAISIPLLLDPGRWRGQNWCDGGIVDIFPVHPTLDLERPPEAVVAVNCFYPREFAGENVEGWRDRPLSILEVAAQVRTAQHVQLARENLRRLRSQVKRVALIDPVDYDEVRGGGFYAQFLERRDWPRYMLAGLRDGRRALSASVRA